MDLIMIGTNSPVSFELRQCHYRRRYGRAASEAMVGGHGSSLCRKRNFGGGQIGDFYSYRSTYVRVENVAKWQKQK
jgi:hypothetical protein